MFIEQVSTAGGLYYRIYHKVFYAKFLNRTGNRGDNIIVAEHTGFSGVYAYVLYNNSNLL